MRVQTTSHVGLLAIALALGGCQHPIYSPTSNLNLFSWASAAAPAKPQPTPAPNAGQKVEMQMSMGESLEREGRLEEAITIYETVLKKDNRRTDVYQRLAIVNDKLGNFQESDKYYRTALKREPKNADLLCDRGYSLYLQNRDAEAEDVLRQALSVSPRMTRAHNNLALVLAHSGRNGQSLEEFARAGCREADARVNLAFCLMARKEWTMAREELQRAAAADPNSMATRDGFAYMRAKAPTEVAQTVPLIALAKPAAVKAPTIVPEAIPVSAETPVASYQMPQIAPNTQGVAEALPPITMVKATFPESLQFDQRETSEQSLARLPDPVVMHADRVVTATEPPPQAAPPAPQPSGSVVRIVIPANSPSSPATQPLDAQAISATGQAGFSSPKSEIRIVERTEAMESIRR